MNDLDIDVSFDGHTLTNSPTELYRVIETQKIIKPEALKGNKHAFAFTLLNIATGEEAVLFFTVTKTMSGFNVQHGSKFACLYRLTIGLNPKARFSKAQGLRRHLEGYLFLCTTELANYTNQECYKRIKDIKPLHPIITNEWTNTGALIGGNRGAYKPRTKATKRKDNGKTLEKLWQNNGNYKHTTPPVNTRDEGVFQTQITANSMSVINRPLPPANTELYPTSNNLNGYDLQKVPEESIDQYYDRVLDTTF